MNPKYPYGHFAMAGGTPARKCPLKWLSFQSDIILLCVRWYLRYPYPRATTRSDSRTGQAMPNGIAVAYGGKPSKERCLTDLTCSPPTEAMNMIRFGQIQLVEKGDIQEPVPTAIPP